MNLHKLAFVAFTINQGIWPNGSDNPTEVIQNEISQQREYNCLNLKKCDERTDRQTDRQTNLCIELRYAQLKMKVRTSGRQGTG